MTISNLEAAIAVFEELLADYESAERSVIGEFSSNIRGECADLEKDVAERRRLFYGALGMQPTASPWSPGTKEKATMGLFTRPPQWVYEVVDADCATQEAWEKWLNTAGSVGWELVAVIPSGVPDLPWRAFFKRPKTND